MMQDLYLRGDVKDKVELFIEQLEATRDHAKSEGNKAFEQQGDIPPPHDELNRLTKKNVKMQRAVEILTAEYPRLVATLEELKAAGDTHCHCISSYPLRIICAHRGCCRGCWVDSDSANLCISAPIFA